MTAPGNLVFGQFPRASSTQSRRFIPVRTRSDPIESEGHGGFLAKRQAARRWERLQTIDHCPWRISSIHCSTGNQPVSQPITRAPLRASLRRNSKRQPGQGGRSVYQPSSTEERSAKRHQSPVSPSGFAPARNANRETGVARRQMVSCRVASQTPAIVRPWKRADFCQHRKRAQNDETRDERSDRNGHSRYCEPTPHRGSGGTTVSPEGFDLTVEARKGPTVEYEGKGVAKPCNLNPGGAENSDRLAVRRTRLER